MTTALPTTPLVRSLRRPLRQAVTLLALALPSLGLQLAHAQASPAPQRGAAAEKSIERALERILQTRPELVSDALKELERREGANKALQEKQVLAQSAREIYSETGATVLGNPNGDFTLVEFSDYRCGFCKRLAGQIEELIQRDSQLRVLVKHMPILGPESIRAAQMVLSLPQGESARQLHQALMAAPSLDESRLQEIGKRFDVSSANAVSVNQQIREVSALSERLRIEGTPALVIGDTLIRGAVDVAQLEHLINTARQSRSAAAKSKEPVTKLAASAMKPVR
jgi:protein-disulfide isomerase